MVYEIVEVLSIVICYPISYGVAQNRHAFVSLTQQISYNIQSK